MSFPATVFARGIDPGEIVRVARTGDEVSIGLNLLIIEDDERRILFDLGAGKRFGDHMGRGPAAMRAAGIEPETIDLVILTHAHRDHLFGALDEEGRPVFPNATHLLSRRERDFWLDPGDPSRAVVSEDAKRSQAEGAFEILDRLAERVSVVDPGDEILPGLRVVDTAGHTPGHVAHLVESGRGRLLVAGDVFHHPVISLARPDWSPVFDQDPEAASATRRRVLETIADTGTLVFSCHFPFPGLGRVERSDEGFVWRPISRSA